MRLAVKILDGGLPKPFYAKENDAGFDLRATESFIIGPGETVMVGTGIAVAIPEGHNGEVRPRSGLSTKKMLAPVNAPGTIDSGYRGEIMVPLHNYAPAVLWEYDEAAYPADKPQMRPIPNEDGIQYVERGERIAQLVITPCVQAEFEFVGELDGTERGATGFGSSGAK